MSLPSMSVVVAVSAANFGIRKMEVSLPVVSLLIEPGSRYALPAAVVPDAPAPAVAKSKGRLSQRALREIARDIRQVNQRQAIRSIWHAAEESLRRNGSVGLAPRRSGLIG